MAPSFQAPSSAMKNCGQFGSSSATRSPRATPSAASAAAQASLSALERAVAERRALEEQRRLVGPRRAPASATIVEQRPVGVRRERGRDAGS